ncbi:two-component sensor histidine kinase [Cystobacter fuscus]|uniref:histidine kinase n=1 Tax=Cystobacter fuscus TaxID=43 RepID=A0A250J7U1_9BACT|nr:HAMP domain-containing sensor histidine kinase [Cystobacter fuscus]ATB39975.1 two-component sensor histidine kinase [Cystobacter fuscus]
MKSDGSAPRALFQVKRNNYLGCAALLLICGGLLHLPVFAAYVRLAPMLLAWAAGFLALGAGVGAGWIPVKVSGVCAGLIGILANTWLVHLTGGLNSPFFPALATMPLLIAMYTPDAWWPTLVSGAAMLGSVALLDTMAHLPVEVMVPQLLALAIIGGVALFGSRTYRRMWDAQKAAQQEHMHALEQLAESERRRVRVERERAEVERLVVVGQLAAGVVHEVNNPLSFVKSNLNYLEREARAFDTELDRAELCDVLAETRLGVTRIEQIVTDLRGFSRGDEGAQEAGMPEEALNEARRLASVRLRNLAEVTMDVSPGLPPVQLGHRHMVQVLLNLLINAADAVELVTPSRPAHIGVGARRVEGGVRVVVEDNGPGLPPEVMSRLFEPFFTTKPPGKGTGLGLTLCREYVTRGGGTLHAENRPEGGARFVLTLPVSRESPPASE